MIDLDKMSRDMATVKAIAIQCGLSPDAPRSTIAKGFLKRLAKKDEKIQMLEDELRELNERS